MRVIASLCLLSLISVSALGQNGEAAMRITDASAPARYQPAPYVKLTHPEWSKNAVIYQVNTRQFTPEGTLRAAQKQLPRLKEFGADIVWLMPVNPIGKKNRKGTLGSPYSVQDYFAVSAELGTMDDLKSFVAEAHRLGMHVILDWVANHTAWDNALVTAHPEWYLRDWKGDFTPTPWWDWNDIINLDYSHAGLRQYMTEALKFWVREADVDGYRCDVAGFVPVDFWNNARKELDAIKPVFLLAEWEDRDLHAEAFDMTYAWTWHNAVRDIATGGARDLGGLFNYYSWNESAYPPDAMRMTYTTNHDANAWEGTEFEKFGAGVEAAIVLSMTGEGMPLIYNGQEAGNTKRLAFFERDPIAWKKHANGELYHKLIGLKHNNPALWNAHWGGRMVNVVNSAPEKVLSFVRRKADAQVLVVINFSAAAKTVSFKDGPYQGRYAEFFSGERVELTQKSTVTLPAWGYKVLVK